MKFPVRAGTSDRLSVWLRGLRSSRGQGLGMKLEILQCIVQDDQVQDIAQLGELIAQGKGLRLENVHCTVLEEQRPRHCAIDRFKDIVRRLEP